VHRVHFQKYELSGEQAPAILRRSASGTKQFLKPSRPSTLERPRLASRQIRQ
jgi:hypothetical protein